MHNITYIVMAGAGDFDSHRVRLMAFAEVSAFAVSVGLSYAAGLASGFSPPENHRVRAKVIDLTRSDRLVPFNQGLGDVTRRVS